MELSCGESNQWVAPSLTYQQTVANEAKL
jgi:hypothetical protein